MNQNTVETPFLFSLYKSLPYSFREMKALGLFHFALNTYERF